MMNIWITQSCRHYSSRGSFCRVDKYSVIWCSHCSYNESLVLVWVFQMLFNLIRPMLTTVSCSSLTCSAACSVASLLHASSPSCSLCILTSPASWPIILLLCIWLHLFHVLVKILEKTSECKTAKSIWSVFVYSLRFLSLYFLAFLLHTLSFAIQLFLKKVNTLLFTSFSIKSSPQNLVWAQEIKWPLTKCFSPMLEHHTVSVSACLFRSVFLTPEIHFSTS